MHVEDSQLVEINPEPSFTVRLTGQEQLQQVKPRNSNFEIHGVEWRLELQDIPYPKFFHPRSVLQKFIDYF